eukprot:1581549-Rhodomonas_salina.2
MDLDAAMSRSESFKMWCEELGITMCQTAGYNHTMQALVEGAISICKEHRQGNPRHALEGFDLVDEEAKDPTLASEQARVAPVDEEEVYTTQQTQEKRAPAAKPATPSALEEHPCSPSMLSQDSLVQTPPAAQGDTPQDHQSFVKDPSEQAQEQRDINSHDPRTWVSGADVPVTVSLQILSDKLLGRALVHHSFQFKLPKEWWYNRKTKQYEAVTAQSQPNGTTSGDCHVWHTVTVALRSTGSVPVTEWGLQRAPASSFKLLRLSELSPPSHCHTVTVQVRASESRA